MMLILQTLWQLPVTIPWWLFWVLPCWLSGAVTYRESRRGLVAIFQVVAPEVKANWFQKIWLKWAGAAYPHAIFLTFDMLVYQTERTIRHEDKHIDQRFKWGMLWDLIYWGDSLKIWLTEPSKHAYLDITFERQAREAAGQPVDIPPELWPDGKNDRWPWW